MKRGLILVNAFSPVVKTRQVSRLAEELTARGVAVTVRRNDLFSLSVTDGRTVGDADCDFCVYLDKDKYVAEMLERTGVRLFNSARAVELCDDKMTTHIALSDSGIPMPDTLPGLLCYDKTAVVPAAAIDRVENRLGYPVIVKLSYGSLGKGVFKADDRAALETLAEQVKTYSHLFQKYIAASHGKDLRVIVVGGKVLGGMLRSSDTDFRSNVGLGGKAIAADVPKAAEDYALKAADILGLDYCGIDFLLSPSPMLCEVNSNAFFDAFEAATGINVAAAYAEHIVRNI